MTEVTALDALLGVYECEIENAAMGYRLMHHVRAVDEADAIARAAAHWGRAVLSVRFRRPCQAWEIMEQRRKDTAPRPDPSDVKIVPSFGG